MLVKQERRDLFWQSNVTHLFEPAKLLIMSFSIEILAHENLLQKYKERVERLSQQDRVIKMCIDAGFLKTV